jgi:hydroxymethylglutaryl-CoA lyase
MAFPTRVKIVEVSPRDGLQNESTILPTRVIVDFIDQLSETGLSAIEATSFVSPKWVPQFKDSDQVYKDIMKKAGVQYPVLVPNLRGLERALEAGVKEIAVFTTASEAFSQKNTNCSVAESLLRIAEVMQVAKQNKLTARGYISCVLGCPYEGDVSLEKISNVAAELLQLGCREISLGDTIGVGTPLKARQLIEKVVKRVPLKQIAVHFHDTYGQALANIFSALESGVSIIDSSVAGLGGCPYAQGASGNVATEEVVYMLNGMGIETGVDINKLAKVGKFISNELKRAPMSKVNCALAQ